MVKIGKTTINPTKIAPVQCFANETKQETVVVETFETNLQTKVFDANIAEHNRTRNQLFELGIRVPKNNKSEEKQYQRELRQREATIDSAAKIERLRTIQARVNLGLPNGSDDALVDLVINAWLK